MQRLAISLVSRELELETGLVSGSDGVGGWEGDEKRVDTCLPWVLDDKKQTWRTSQFETPQGHFEEVGTGKWNG